jgi:hypothetical protein
MTDLDALEATARAATPGPWELDGMGEDEPEINYWAHLFIGTVNPNESGSHEIIATSEDRHGPNAKHIAAFDPPTALALIARLREAEELIEKIDAEIDQPVTDSEALVAIELHLAAYKTTKTESTDRENGSER